VLSKIKVGKILLFSLVLFCVGFSLSGCTKKDSKPNVILLVIDTLRSDMLPVYGEHSDLAPFMTELGKQGVVFKNAFSTSSWTAPATASILTGLYPLEHGILMGRRSTRKLHGRDPSTKLNAIPKEVTTIAEIMKENGFATFAAVDNGNIREDSGFAQGFDKFATFQNVGGDNINKTILDWASGIKKSERYFLYIQYMDPHHPYIEHEKWFKGGDKHGMERLKYAYQSEVSFTDEKVKEIYQALGWDKNTIILITSDHGEEFGEHGAGGHGKTLYNEVTNVPFIVYYPDGQLKSGLREDYVGSIDALPTLVELAGLKLKHEVTGHSLLPLLKVSNTSPQDRLIYSHLWKTQKAGSIVEMKSSIKTRKKLILSSKAKKDFYFDLEKDPFERHNIAGKHSTAVAASTKELNEYEQSFKKYEREWIEVPLNEDDFEE